MKWLLLLPLAGVLVGGPLSAAELRDPFAAIGIDSPPDARIPSEARFRDESGTVVALGDYLDRGPIVLAPVYYRCPNLCGTTLSRLAASLRNIPLSPGADYTAIAVSIDPREKPADAADVKSRALANESDDARDGFHLLTGTEAEIRALMQAIGFRYRWDSDLQQYAHPAVLAVLTPQGKIARWLDGFSYGPADLRVALLEAGQGRTGSLADRLLLLCYHYNPMTGRYDGAIRTALQWSCAATALGLIGLAVRFIRRERRAKAAHRQGSSA